MNATREQIIETTSALLEKQGCFATGLNEIIRESGSPKGSLYYHFPDGKDQIVSEAIQQSGKLVSGRIHAGLAGAGSIAERLYRFILLIAEQVETSHFSAGSPLTATAMETAASSQKINLACRAAYGKITAAFETRLLESGLAAERAKELSVFITAAIEGGIILSRTSHDAAPLRLVARQLRLILKSQEPGE